MSSKELDRLAIMRRVVEGRLTQAKAAKFIGLSERQVRRLCAAFEERGPAGLVSGKRGLTSSRRRASRWLPQPERRRQPPFGKPAAEVRRGVGQDLAQAGRLLGA